MARSIEQAFESLGSEIERLPLSSKIRVRLGTEHAWAERRSDIPAYRLLCSQVTNARFEFAKTDIFALKAELAHQGGLIEWNPSPWQARLEKWLLGYEASDFDTVNAFFNEASDIAEELDRQIWKASQPRYSPRPTVREPGKTKRERESGKTARTARNGANRAETNRGHEKGLSPGVDKRGKGGKKGKKK